MDNGTSHSYCKWYLSAGAALEIPIYYVTIPICICLGLLGHATSLVVFYKQSKVEPAYFYQVALTVSESCYLLLVIPYCMMMIFYWNPNGSSAWYQQNYALMWIMAHLATPLVNMAFTTNQFFIISMAVDRVFALWRPLLYKQRNHKVLRFVASSTSVILGVSTSIFDCFRYSDPSLGRSKGYKLIVSPFLNSAISKGLSRLRDVIHLVNLFALVTLNIALFVAYRKGTKKVSRMNSRTDQEKRQKNRKEEEITLLLLAIFQCGSAAIYTISHTAFYLALSINPSFENCGADFWAPLLDATFLVIDAANFYAVVIVSKQFRRLIAQQLPCARRLVGIWSDNSA